MSERNEFDPNWASLPGATMVDCMEERHLDLQLFAHRMNMRPFEALRLLIGRTEITEEIGQRLANVLGGTAGFWISRDCQYREKLEQLGEAYSQVKRVRAAMACPRPRFGDPERTHGFEDAMSLIRTALDKEV